MKHTLCDLQEKIFHLQIQLLEEDIAGGETETNETPQLWLVTPLQCDAKASCLQSNPPKRYICWRRPIADGKQDV